LRFLVTFALGTEFAAWRAAEKFAEERNENGDAAFRTEREGAEVTVLLTGVGAQRAGRRVTRWLKQGERYDAVISSGFGGGLRKSLNVGDVVAAGTVTCEPFDPSARAGRIESSRALMEFAEACSARRVDRFYTVAHVISTAAEKRALGESADVVEMESFDVMLAAKQEGIPSIGIRAVSDVVDEDMPLDMADILTEDGRVSVSRVLGQAMLRPQAVPGLMRLGKQSKQAAGALASFLSVYVGHIASKMNMLEARAVERESGSAFIQ